MEKSVPHVPVLLTEADGAKLVKLLNEATSQSVLHPRRLINDLYLHYQADDGWRVGWSRDFTQSSVAPTTLPLALDAWLAPLRRRA